MNTHFKQLGMTKQAGFGAWWDALTNSDSDYRNKVFAMKGQHKRRLQLAETMNKLPAGDPRRAALQSQIDSISSDLATKAKNLADAGVSSSGNRGMWGTIGEWLNGGAENDKDTWEGLANRNAEGLLGEEEADEYQDALEWDGQLKASPSDLIGEDSASLATIQEIPELRANFRVGQNDYAREKIPTFDAKSVGAAAPKDPAATNQTAFDTEAKKEADKIAKAPGAGSPPEVPPLLTRPAAGSPPAAPTNIGGDASAVAAQMSDWANNIVQSAGTPPQQNNTQQNNTQQNNTQQNNTQQNNTQQKQAPPQDPGASVVQAEDQRFPAAPVGHTFSGVMGSGANAMGIYTPDNGGEPIYMKAGTRPAPTTQPAGSPPAVPQPTGANPVTPAAPRSQPGQPPQANPNDLGSAGRAANAAYNEYQNGSNKYGKEQSANLDRATNNVRQLGQQRFQELDKLRGVAGMSDARRAQAEAAINQKYGVTNQDASRLLYDPAGSEAATNDMLRQQPKPQPNPAYQALGNNPQTRGGVVNTAAQTQPLLRRSGTRPVVNTAVPQMRPLLARTGAPGKL